MKKQFAFVLACVLAVCLFANVTPAKDGPWLTQTQDFSQSTLDPEYWIVNNSDFFKVENGAIQSSTAAVYGLSFGRPIWFEPGYEMKFDLRCSVSEAQKDGGWMTTYVMLRMPTTSTNATGNDAVAIALRDNQIGMRTGGWPATEYLPDLPYGFENFRTVRVVDKGSENVIEIYVADGAGKEALAAQVVIDGGTATMYDAKKTEDTKITCAITTVPNEKVYAGFWVHNIPGVGLDNISIKYKEFIRDPYVPINQLNYIDAYEDTWVATDDLGRKTPTFEEVGAPRDKDVGIFYFLWHDQEVGAPDREIYDHYQAYLDGGVQGVWDMIPQGPMGFAHYWGQPYFGYYLSNDRWVIRKHAQMLTEAGIDFIYFDCSNAITYQKMYTAVLDEWKQIREEGGKTPKVCWFYGDNTPTAEGCLPEIYNDIYKDGYYSELWYYWDGKPLALGNFETTDPELVDKFTVRRCWAYNGWTGDGKGKWAWIAEYPQAPGRNPETGEIEQMPVSCGFHPNGSTGRSFVKGQQTTAGQNDFEFALMDTTTPLGLAYEELMNEALRVDPKVIMADGWNEWWAGRWGGPGQDNPAVGQHIANTYYVNPSDPVTSHYYVDAFNPEFSRDFEPMKGGFGDNYLYQMTIYNRKFKGVRPIPAATGQKTITLNGDFSQWNSVWPEYRDVSNIDTTRRDWDSFLAQYHYTNDSGRNDFELAKASCDDTYWYFYVKTRDNITAPMGRNWMNLYIDTDQNSETGWCGYDILIGRQQKDNLLSVEKVNGNQWSFTNIGSAKFEMAQNQMHLVVPREFLNIDDGVGFDFKWADNSVKDGDVMQFLDQGDAMPNARFNFRYTTKAQQVPLDSALSELLSGGAVAMEINKNTAFTKNGQVRIDELNTGTKPFVLNGRTVLPVRFLAETLGAEVTWYDETKTATINLGGQTITITAGQREMFKDGESIELDVPATIIDGRTFLPLRKIAEALGRAVTWDDRGIVIISDQEITDSAIIEEIWRKL